MQNHLKFIFLSALLSFSATGQSDSTAAQPTYTPIPSSYASIVMPEGFTVSSTGSAISNLEKAASIGFEDIIGHYKYATKQYSNKTLLKQQGFEIINREIITLNDREATFIEAKQHIHDNEFFVQYLIIGNISSSCVIKGICMANDDAMIKKIRKAMLTTTYDKKDYHSEVIHFTLEAEKLGFRKVNTLLYALNGPINDKTPVFNIKSVDMVVDESQRHPSEDAAEKYKEKGIKLILTTPVTIDDMEGFIQITESTNSANGLLQRHYTVFLFHDKGYYILQGTAADNFETNMELFEKLSETFKHVQ